MSLVTAIYLVSIISSFDGFLHLLQIIYMIGLFCFVVSALVHNLDHTKCFINEYKKQLKAITVIFILTCAISVFLPTKTEMYAMLAVNQSSELKLDETAKKGIEVLNIKLDEIIAESKKN